jgi:coenzyme PQQ precursor peptide PqqA
MQWTKPEFREISLGGEMTAYVNTDARVRASDAPDARSEARSDVTEPREVRA